MSSSEFGRMEDIRNFSYQVIIAVTYDDGRLFPLTEDCPKCLLPIANRILLAYQLDVLKKSGASGLWLIFKIIQIQLFPEIYVVTPTDYQAQLSQFIAQYSADFVIEIVPVSEMIGSADAVRAVADRIRGDFIVFNSDTLSQINLGELVHTHRLHSSDVTMLLSAIPLEESDKKGGNATLKVFSFHPIRSLVNYHTCIFRSMRRIKNTLPSPLRGEWSWKHRLWN